MTKSLKILSHFAYGHLPPALGAVSAPFHNLAHQMANALPVGPELHAGLRKLLEAKDCFVRAHLEAHPMPARNPNYSAAHEPVTLDPLTREVLPAGSPFARPDLVNTVAPPPPKIQRAISDAFASALAEIDIAHPQQIDVGFIGDGPQPFKEIVSSPFSDAKNAIADWRRDIHNFLADERAHGKSVIRWRVRPELKRDHYHDTWIVYSRLDVLPEQVKLGAGE